MENLAFPFLFLCAAHISYAKHILYPGESLLPNQSLVSENGEFKFGFFTPGTVSDSPDQSSPYYYIGIWLSNTVSHVEPPTLDYTAGVAWVGNRENPVLKSESCVVNLTRNGDLILTQFQKLVWSSDASGSESVSGTVLHLLDTGNLVLLNRTNLKNVIWQSFYHPTDTWFPGMVLGFTDINGENSNMSLVSWKGSGDPSPGMYSLEIGPPKTWKFIIREVPKNILFFGAFPEWIDIQDLHNGLITFNYTNRSATEDTTPYFQLLGTGVLQLIHNYHPIWKSPGANCANTSCGAYGMCLDNSVSSSCKCPYGFSNMSSDDTARSGNTTAGPDGCARNISWSCHHHHSSHDSNRYSFYLLKNLIKLPDNSQYLGVWSLQGCESACLNNCSCTAYASGAGCNLWYGDLMNIIARDDGMSGEQLYVRIAVSDSATKLPIEKLIFGGAFLMTFVICLVIFWVFRAKFVSFRTDNNKDQLSVYSYVQMKYATRNFSVKLGEGGFGSVFKGRLSNNTEVTVKKLKILGQEEKQFRRGTNNRNDSTYQSCLTSRIL